MYFYTTLDMFLPVKMLYFSTRESRVPIGPDPPATIISLVLEEKGKYSNNQICFTMHQMLK